MQMRDTLAPVRPVIDDEAVAFVVGHCWFTLFIVGGGTHRADDPLDLADAPTGGLFAGPP